MSQLSELKKLTTIVADTGDIEAIRKHRPTDATTNPSLILKAYKIPDYKPLVDEAVSFALAKGSSKTEIRSLTMDKLFVNFGCEILKIVPGRVSTEVDAKLSFDVEGSINKAHQLIGLYEEAGIDRKRVLIKLASTWEGIVAARQLETEGIHCNMTLMFSLAQAIASAEAKATLISPFVGRIFDWYKKAEGVDHYPPAEDPGVESVTQIYHYLKKFDYPIQIMGASFRNKDQITELAGCDLLTIAPDLLEELESSNDPITQKLAVEEAKASSIEKIHLEEKSFRWMLNEDPMGTEKLAEGIRNFAKDYGKLESLIIDSYKI